MSISIEITRDITDQRVCLKINASLFGESANTGSLAVISQYLLKKTSRPVCVVSNLISFLPKT